LSVPIHTGESGETSAPQMDGTDLDNRIKKSLEEFKVQVIAEWHQHQGACELSHAREDEQFQQNSREIAKLAVEIEALRKALDGAIATLSAPVTPSDVKDNIRKPEIKTEPLREATVEKPAQVTDPMRSVLMDALVGPACPVGKSAPLPEKTERKIAFLAKLWDYLNHVAFELPINKSDRAD
jgi:hypothetical protein